MSLIDNIMSGFDFDKFKPSTDIDQTVNLKTNRAMSEGVGYAMGGKSSAKGKIDCSGWVCENLKAAGIDISDTAAGLAQRAAKNNMLSDNLNDIGPGSLIFLANNNNPGHAKGRFKNIGHTGLVIEKDGRLFVSESRSGKGVDLTPLDHYLASRSKRNIIYHAPVTAYGNTSQSSASMVADATGQTVPDVQYQQPTPEKTAAINATMPAQPEGINIPEILKGIVSKLGPAEAEAAPPPAPKQKSLIDDIMSAPGEIHNIYGTQEVISTAQPDKSQALPMTPAAEGAPSLITHAKVGMVDDPKAKFALLAAKRFPNEPPELAAKRYFMKDGNIFFISNDQKVYREIPDTTFQNAKALLGQSVLGRIPEIGGAIAGSALLPLAPAIGAGLGATGGSITRQQIAESFLGDTPKSIGDVALTAAQEGIVNAAGMKAGPMLTRGLNFGARKMAMAGPIGKIAAKDAPFFDRAEMNRLIDLGAKFDIHLTAPEITQSPTLRAAWANVAKMPGLPAEKINRFVQTIRLPQISKSIERELSAISPTDDIYTAGERAAQTSRGIHDILKTQRAAKSGPLYKAARESAPDVDVSPVLDTIESLAVHQAEGGKGQATLAKLRQMLTQEGDEPGKRIPETRIGKLHSAKEEIDDLLDAVDNKETSLPHDIMRLLTQVKGDLLEAMSKASPEYDKARQTFRLYSKPINDLRWGNPDIMPSDKPTKTIMERLMKLDGEAVGEAPSIVFGGKSSPKAIERTRKWFIASGNEEAWNDLVRARLQDTLQKSVKDSIANKEGNIGYSFKQKVFGNQLERNKLKAAMTPEQYNRWSEFMSLLDVTNRIVYTNSQTAFQLGTSQEIRREAGGPIAKLLRNLNISPNKMAEQIEYLREPKYAAKLTEQLIDPASAKALKRIYQIPSKPRQAIEFLTWLGITTGITNITQPGDVPLER